MLDLKTEINSFSDVQSNSLTLWGSYSTLFVTEHTFCASRDTPVSYGWCLLIQGYFCAVLNYAEKAGTQQIGGNHAFFRDNKALIWKKTPYIALYFTAFLNYCCLIISEKCMVTPNFLSGFQYPLLKYAFPA